METVQSVERNSGNHSNTEKRKHNSSDGRFSTASLGPSLGGKNSATEMPSAVTDQQLSSIQCEEGESATPISHKNSTFQLRSSTRACKKLKLDVSSPVATPSVQPDKKETSKEEEKAEDKKETDVKKRRRGWELWSVEDKNTFFEALNEYGKDFDSIQSYFAHKMKKKGLPDTVIKNKDQVRHFYYRTWHKISKYLNFSNEVKKATRELYGLINYGELRKKIGGLLSEKSSVKLNELIYKGTTQIKIRGKTHRIKTPMCRALRKLNQVQDTQEDLRLPSRVLVELRPMHNEAWAAVQSTAQNPRVRTYLPLQRRLSSLLTYLQNRWRPHEVKYRDRLIASSPFHCDQKKQPEPKLRVIPKTGANVCLPTINISEYLTGSSLCLKTYQERTLNPGLKNSIRAKYKGKNCIKRNRRQKSESEPKESEVKVSTRSELEENCRKFEDSGEERIDDYSTTMERLNCSIDCASDLDINAAAVESILSLQQTLDSVTNTVDKISECRTKDIIVNHVLNPKTETSSGGEEKPSETKCVEEIPKKEHPSTSEATNCKVKTNDSCSSEVDNCDENEQKISEEKISQIREGWTVENAVTITIGELYLMFGSEGKIQLEYKWDFCASQQQACPKEEETLPVEPDSTFSSKESSDNTLSRVNEVELKTKINSIAAVLQKLASLAKMNLKKLKMSCPCGHVCSGSTKTSVSRPRVAATKINKSSVTTDSSEKHETDLAKEKVEEKEVKTVNKITIPNPVLRPVNTTLPVLHDGVFRRPLLAPSQRKTLVKPGAEEAFKAQLDKFKPRYCNRRGRSGRKNVVVQRVLPLLPKSPNGHAMVTLKVIPQTSQLSGGFIPMTTPLCTSAPVLTIAPSPSAIQPAPSVPLQQNTKNMALPQCAPAIPQNVQPIADNSLQEQNQSCLSQVKTDTVQVSECSHPQAKNEREGISRTVADVPLSVPSSPPNISSLFEMSLPMGELALNEGSESQQALLDVSLQDSNANFVDLLANEAANQAVSGSCGLQTPVRVPSPEIPSGLNTPVRVVSPELTSGTPSCQSRMLKDPDNQWLNSEVADFSLSSFLGHLESPLKSSVGTTNGPNAEDTRMSSDVDAQLQCLMSENSVDYMAKFADLAAQIASDTQTKK